MYTCNTEVCSCNHCFHGKEMAYYMCVCILDLVMQHANQIFSALCCTLWPVWLYHIFHII